MKIDPSGRPDVTAPDSSSDSGGSRRRKPFLRRLLIVCLVAAMVALAGFVMRHALFGRLLTLSLGIATGDQVSIEAFRIGLTRSTFTGVRVTTPTGDPLLDADRVTLEVSLPALLTDRVHRFGILGLELDRPVLSIVRRADGSYNVGNRAAGGSGAGGSSGASVPWNLSVRVRGGEIRLIDRAPTAEDLNDQRIVGLDVVAALHSGQRSTAIGSARFIGRQTQADTLRSWPLELGAFVDYPRGIANVRINAVRLPLRGIIGFLAHSGAVRVDDGMLHNCAIRMFGLDIDAAEPLALHFGGSAEVTSGRLRIAALRLPVRDVRGRLTLTDDGIWTTRLDARLGTIPIVARGGAFDRLEPSLRLALSADADLRDLRAMFAFSQHQPVRGAAHVETLLEAPVSNLLIRSNLSVDRGAYADAPLDDVRGRVDYHSGAVVIGGVSGRFGPVALGLGARFLLGAPALDSLIAATGRAPGRAVPFAENLAPEANVDAVALFTGGRAGFRAGGSIAVAGDGIGGGGTFAVDERGRGEFGPFSIVRADGSSVDGALRLERPVSRSAAWISAREYRVAVPLAPSRLPGISVPSFPPVAGVIDGDVAGGGSPDAFALSGGLRARGLRIGTLALGSGTVRLGGTLADLRLGDLVVAGPLGRLQGSAAVQRGSVGLRGAYSGSLERLEPLTGRQEAHGAVRGRMLATIAGGDIVVQSTQANLLRGSIRGVALDTAAGTIAVRNSRFHLLTGTASIGGRRAVAAERNGTIAVSAPNIPSKALRGTGLPLQGGNVSAYGVADLRSTAPKFDGTVAVESGRARGYDIGGDAWIDLERSSARISAATGALGSTYGSIAGSISGIGSGALRYDLDARVPLGDIDAMRRDLTLPVRHLEGSFAAQLHVHGTGSRPFAEGRIQTPEAMYNGLALRDGGARIILDPDGVAAREGTVSVGSTRLDFAASIAGGAFGVSAQSSAIDLADFNDYFDASDTLAGRGRFGLTLRTDGGRLRTRGALAFADARFERFTLGQAAGSWVTRGSTITGRANLRGAAGSLGVDASMVPQAGSDPISAMRGARYHARAIVAGLDLASWLPAGRATDDIRGRLDGQLTVDGRFPRLTLSADAALSAASIRGYAVRTAHLHARGAGSQVDVLSADADLGFAQLAGSGRLGADAGDPLAFDLRVSSADVGAAAQTFVPALRGFDISGALEADIRVTGTRAAPKVAGGFDLAQARYRGFVVPRAIGALALAGNTIDVRDADVEFARGQAFVAGSLPLVLRPFGIGPARAPLSFDVTARGVDLAQFAPLFPAGTALGGTIDGRFGVEGTVDRPRLFGSAEVSDGSYRSAFERAPIEHVGANLVFEGTSVALAAFHAGVGGGTLDGDGRITLPIGARPSVGYRVALRAKAARLDFPAYGRGTIDAQLALSGGGGEPLISGNIDVRNAVVPVSAVYGSSSAVAGAGGRLPIDPAFALHVTAGDDVRIRSSIVDIGVTGAVDLSGKLQAPQLAGGFTATDGTISSYNHVFRIVNAAVTFNPADGAIPTVAARAMSRVTNPDPDPSRNIAGSANIIVTVSGTADNNLSITYSSDPAYSQEQIIGLLLDVPALLGAVNFNLNGGPGGPVLRGAPGETNALLPPGVTPEQVSAISFNQEVFSLLNGQFTQRALSPIERVFEKYLGLSDIEFTVDYGGGIGYSLRRQLGKRDFDAFLSQTVTYPERVNLGLELSPKPFESYNFSLYAQNGITSLITNATPGEEFLSSTRRLTSVQPLGNRSGFTLNYNRRF